MARRAALPSVSIRRIARPSLTAVVLGIAAAACGAQGQTNETTGTRGVPLSVRPGEVFAYRPYLALVAPWHGQSSWAEVLFDDGQAEEVRLETSIDGLVYLVEDANDTAFDDGS